MKFVLIKLISITGSKKEKEKKETLGPEATGSLPQVVMIKGGKAE